MAGVRQMIDKLRGVRHIEWALIAAALAAMLMMAGSSERSAEETGSSLERRMENVLSCIRGAGEVRVIVNEREAVSAFAGDGAPVTGVLVVAEGAGELRVALELQQAVQTLLGVEAGQIEILVMEETEK